MYGYTDIKASALVNSHHTGNKKSRHHEDVEQKHHDLQQICSNSYTTPCLPDIRSTPRVGGFGRMTSCCRQIFAVNIIELSICSLYRGGER